MLRQDLVAQRYQIGDMIGKGGMGTVYQGIDTVFDKAVAIKILRREMLMANPEIVERFAREADILRHLNHPNIVKVFGVFHEHERHAIVMEYVSGGTLGDLLQEHPQLSIERTLQIGLEIADALTRTHHLKVIHRDIKPMNVLLASDGTPRLTDFGAALALDTHRITQTGAVLGTFAYLSPEALSSHPLDERTDIWSFGVMLYQMLVGRCPFGENQPLPVLINAIMTQNPTPIVQLRADIPLELADLIGRMLRKNREERVSSVRQIGAELEAILRGQPIPTLQTPPPPPLEDEDTREMYLVPHNLPTLPTPFVGRQTEVAEIAALLDRDEVRLVTLTGMGGVGKTRLALEVMGRKLLETPSRLRAWQDGIYFVSLGPLREAFNIIPTILSALGVQLEGTTAPDVGLINYLRDKHIALVLDNFEHLMEGADTIAWLLDQVPTVKFLITSREALNLQQEWVRPIQAMHLPPATSDGMAEAVNYSAVQLFLDRAKRVRADFTFEGHEETILKICRMVEGMPLALELAAAWLKTLPCEEVAREIETGLDFLTSNQRNLPARHRSLRAIFESSWELLNPKEQDGLAKLTLFRSDFTRDAAHYVGGVRLPLLTALVDKSLLQVNADGRYRMHEMIRQYAREKLTASADEASTRECYANYFAEMLAREYGRVFSPHLKDALDVVENELENIRSAWEWMTEQARFDLIEQAMEMVYYYYRIRQEFAGGRLFAQTIEALEGKATTKKDQIAFARLLALLGWFSSREDNKAEAAAVLERAIEIMRKYHAEAYLAMPLMYLAVCSPKQRPDAQHLLEEAVTVAEKHGLWYDRTTALYFLSDLYFQNNAPDIAHRHLAEVQRISEEKQFPEAIADIHTRLGWVHLEAFQLDKAESHFLKAFEASKSIGDVMGIASTTQGIGMIAERRGDYEMALAYYKKSLKFSKQLSNSLKIGLRLLQIANLYRLQGELDEARHYYEKTLQFAHETNDPTRVIYAYLGLAEVAEAAGEYLKAHTLLEGIHFDQQTFAKPSINLGARYYALLARVLYQRGADEAANAALLNAMEPLLHNHDADLTTTLGVLLTAGYGFVRQNAAAALTIVADVARQPHLSYEMSGHTLRLLDQLREILTAETVEAALQQNDGLVLHEILATAHDTLIQLRPLRV